MKTMEKEKSARLIAPAAGRPAEFANILLVDDERRNLDALESILTAPDLRLVRAQNAEDALLALMNNEFACVVLDIQMPQMSGLDLARLIKTRKRNQHIPIIFLTAYFLEERDILHGYDVGAVDYLTKPVNPQILKSKVGVFVDLFRSARALASANATLESEIAQRKHVEEILRRNNSDLELHVQQRARAAHHLAAIVKSSDDAIISKDTNGIITSWNDSAERLFGFTAAEAIGKSISIIIPPERHNEEKYILSSIRRGEPVHNFETVRRRKDGQYLDISLTVSPIKDADGKIIGASKIARDITVQKRHEQALRDSKQELAAETEALSRLNASALHLWRMSFEEGLLEMLNTTIQMMRADMGNIQLLDSGGHVLKIMAQKGFKADFLNFFREVSAADDSACGRVLKSGERIVIEDVELDEPYAPMRPIARAAGYRAVQSTPLIGREGQTLGVFSTHWSRPHRPSEAELRRLDLYVRQASDFIERKRAEETLRESETRFKQLAENIPQLAWMTNADGWIFWFNQRWYDYTGATFERMQGWGWESVQHPDALARVKESWTRALATGEPWEDTFPLRAKDGEFRWFLSRAFPIRDAEGKIYRWFGTNTDITEQRKTLQALRESESNLIAASQAKDDFLATLSHELRTPLNPILLVASDAAHNFKLPAPIRSDFEMIRKNIELEARLIDDLLDLTRVTRGKIILDKRLLDVHSVLKDAIANVQEEIKQKGIALAAQFCADHQTVFGDGVRLQQVFWNLLKNAVKFTPAGGRIAVETKSPDENKIIVRVADTGIGMNAKEIERIFNAFSQGDHADGSTRHRFGGLGLGLAISQKLVEFHHGKIVAASAGRDKGSTFTVELPVATATEINSSRDLLRLSSDSPSDAGVEGIKVLLVEDHEPTRTALAQLLARRQYQVVTAASLAEARSHAARQTFDLLISDIGLPDGTGYELMTELSQKNSIRGIALTGYGMEQDLARSEKAGFMAHLTKPIGIQSLETALNAVCAQ